VATCTTSPLPPALNLVSLLVFLLSGPRNFTSLEVAMFQVCGFVRCACADFAGPTHTPLWLRTRQTVLCFAALL
jgi:hypothetical protein